MLCFMHVSRFIIREKQFISVCFAKTARSCQARGHESAERGGLKGSKSGPISVASVYRIGLCA